MRVTSLWIKDRDSALIFGEDYRRSMGFDDLALFFCDSGSSQHITTNSTLA